MISGDVIEEAGQPLAAIARQPARVLLFGSHARGDAGPHSDLDFLVIERDVRNRRAGSRVRRQNLGRLMGAERQPILFRSRRSETGVLDQAEHVEQRREPRQSTYYHERKAGHLRSRSQVLDCERGCGRGAPRKRLAKLAIVCGHLFLGHLRLGFGYKRERRGDPDRPNGRRARCLRGASRRCLAVADPQRLPGSAPASLIATQAVDDTLRLRSLTCQRSGVPLVKHL